MTTVVSAPHAAQAEEAQAVVHGELLPYNTSFYLIAPKEYPSHVRVYDHRATLTYLWKLCLFHLGYEVIP